ncbi:hypothetical protein CHS0354_006651 [Potamilus streckersoni]|uniref:Uncharacterized protein n=1 Tax=Potamilus streckersoni TaxID=2493646 RepID=A0AAE0W3V4_9BIVA|nr:hypothetical protein CHS0354_006651 [Potamilus streckersoni]
MVASSDTTFTGSMSDICTETPNTAEYHVLLKHVALSSVKVTCPTPFLGTFSYSYNDGSSSLCGAGNEHLDVCTDRQSMYINKTVCKANVGYSSAICKNISPSESAIEQTKDNHALELRRTTLTNQTTPTSSNTSGSSINIAVIAGSVAGGMLFIIVIIVIIFTCKKKASKSKNSSDQLKTCLIGSDEEVEHPGSPLTSQRLFVSMATMTDISMVEFRAENTNQTIVEELPSRPGTSSTALPPLSPVSSEGRKDMVIGIRTENIDVTSPGVRYEQEYTDGSDGLHPQDDDPFQDDPGTPVSSRDQVKVIHLPLTSQDMRHGTDGFKDNHEMSDTAQFMESVETPANNIFPGGSRDGQELPYSRGTNAEQGYLGAETSQMVVVARTEQAESSPHVSGDGQTSEMTQGRNNRRTIEILQDGHVSQPAEPRNTLVLNNGSILSHTTANEAKQINSNLQTGGSRLSPSTQGKTEQSSTSMAHDERGSTQMMVVHAQTFNSASRLSIHEQTRQTERNISQMMEKNRKEPDSTREAQRQNQAYLPLEESSSNLRFVSEGAAQQLREVDPVLVHFITSVVLSDLRQQGLLKNTNVSIEPNYVAGGTEGISSRTQNSQVLSHGQGVSNTSQPVSPEGHLKTTNETATSVGGSHALIQRQTTGPMLSDTNSNSSSSDEPQFPLGHGVEFRELKENWQFERGTFVKQFNKDVRSATVITNLDDTNIPGQPLYD